MTYAVGPTSRQWGEKPVPNLDVIQDSGKRQLKYFARVRGQWGTAWAFGGHGTYLSARAPLGRESMSELQCHARPLF